MKNISIIDPDFPQVGYDTSEEELIEKLETDKSLPKWWKDYYQKLLIERWKKET